MDGSTVAVQTDANKTISDVSGAIDLTDGQVTGQEYVISAVALSATPSFDEINAAYEAGTPVTISGANPSVFASALGLVGTSLASTLNACRVDTVLITGFSTSGCVRATALDALQHGFAPFVVREACGDRDARPHEANLFDLQAKYAEVITLERALQELARRPQG